MKIDPSTPEREVLIRYLESSGVNQQKEAAAEMRKMQAEIDRLTDQSLTSRIALWFKKGK